MSLMISTCSGPAALIGVLVSAVFVLVSKLEAVSPIVEAVPELEVVLISPFSAPLIDFHLKLQLLLIADMLKLCCSKSSAKPSTGSDFARFVPILIFSSS